MQCFQPYHDVPGIQDVDDCLSSGLQWTSIDPSLDTLHSQDYNSAHTWNIQQRLASYQQSVNGYGRLSPLQIPEEQFSGLVLQSPWNTQPDAFRHLRTLSPGCALGGNSATDSMASEETMTPDIARHYPSVSRMPPVAHRSYPSPSPQYTAGNGSWMAQTLYSNALPSSPYAASDHSACNLKDLEYSHVEADEERPSATEHPHPLLHLQPEEVAFADEGIGRSIGDEDSIKESDEEEEEPQRSDVDSDYSPSHKRRGSTARGGRSSPRRTRSLQTTTSPILDSSAKITKPAHAYANHRRTSSGTAKGLTRNGTSNGKRPAKSFPCTFSHYGCPSIFGSKNEFKRHTNTQHLQLGYYRCDVGFCNPANNPANKSPSFNDFNRKDLFTQHHRRMHVPFSGKYENANQKQKDEFDASMEEVRDRCWVVRREPPEKSECGVCRKGFEGENSWEERMEHVGKHFERGEGAGGDVGEDEYLTGWAVREGLVRNLGVRGMWLVGLEPVEGRDSTVRVSRRGRRSAVQAMDDDEE